MFSGQLRKHSTLLVLVSLLLVFVWFSDGKILSGGEESFSIFNERDLVPINGIWENIATGYLNPTYLTRIPLSVFARALLYVGVATVHSQALIYFFMLSLGGISLYFLTKKLTHDKTGHVSLIASVFYIFNTYSTFQVFSRFLYSTLFLWAYMPLALYLWIDYYRYGKRWSLFFFLTSSVVMSLSYLQPAHIITFWVPLLLWSFIDCKKIYRLIVGGFLWATVNVWWLYPFIKLKDLAFSEISTYQQNVDTIKSLSQYFGLDQVLTLRQKYILSLSPWSEYYNQPIIIVFGIVMFFLLLLGLRRLRSTKNAKYILTTFAISLFIVKGTNSPLGELFYNLIFKYIPSTAALRNPYEKFGIVYVIFFSILVGIGAADFIRNKIKAISLFALIVSLSLPLISGEIMVTKKVSPPSDYSIVNSWIVEDKSSGRIFHMPPSPGDSVSYIWGYTGVDPSEYLFDNASVSKIIRTAHYDDKYKKIVAALSGGDNIAPQLDELGIRYVILHRDVKPQKGWITEEQVENFLLNSNFDFKGRAGQLELYVNSGDGSDIFEFQGEGEFIDIKKLSERHMTVIYTSPQDTTLVFKTTYSPLWEAYIGNQELPHIIIYDYANAWDLPAGKDISIDIKLPVWPWE